MPEKPPDPLSPEDFAAAFPVSRETLTRLEVFLDQLTKWNRAINLVSRRSLEDPWRRHILDSAQLSPFVPASAKSVVDLGSGAGLPGLVLAILNPDKDIHLIESDRRKAAFLQEAARVTNSRISLHTDRIEDSIDKVGPVDAVTARALAPLPTLLEYIQPILNEKKLCIFPKSGGIYNEIEAVTERWGVTYEVHPSLSDPRGRIVILEARNRVSDQTEQC